MLPKWQKIKEEFYRSSQQHFEERKNEMKKKQTKHNINYSSESSTLHFFGSDYELFLTYFICCWM
jgi:hypothetical protein